MREAIGMSVSIAVLRVCLTMKPRLDREAADMNRLAAARMTAGV